MTIPMKENNHEVINVFREFKSRLVLLRNFISEIIIFHDVEDELGARRLFQNGPR